MTRALVGNLDCEVAWAGGPPLPAAVRDRLALLATTLRVFASDDDDVLWLPAAVAPAAIPRDHAPRPRLITGPLPIARGAAGDDTVVTWGADDRLAGAASRSTTASSWQAALPGAPVPVAVARTVNDRRFALAIATELGVALPGARAIASVAELRAHLAAGGAAASPTGAWVAKAPLTAAGRDRVRRRGDAIDDATATRIERLLAIHGALVVEPWLDRVADVSQGGVVLERERAIVVPPHRGLCDASGVIRALAIDGDDRAGLDDPARRQLAHTVAVVAARLGAAGYRGPFVVDGFVHAGGFHPLGEINARLTFGLVARAWAERLGTPLVLGLGGAAPPDATALVHADDGTAAAWWAPARS